MKNADMPAMPVELSGFGSYEPIAYTGLTKREMMAMHIMCGIAPTQFTPKYGAEQAVSYADALLAELGKGGRVMTRENEMLALLESREAEANAEAEWIADWCDANRPLLLAGMLETDPATLLGELNADQHRHYNQAIWLMMNDGEQAPLMQFIDQVVDAGLAELAKEAWGYHLAALHDAMSEEQFEQYQHRSAA